jgi:hypothetical protein
MDLGSSYKAWHRPNQRPDAKTSQGYYRITNKEKYVGDSGKVIYRSSWELSFLKWCDFSPSILRYSSEPTSVPYYDRVSNLNECKRLGLDPKNPRNWKVRNYHVDFWLEIKRDEDIIEKWFVEIKPEKDLKRPVPPSINCSLKEQRRFNNMTKTYLINEAKFAAMKEWASKNNCKFYVFTEKTLSRLLGKFWDANSKI